MAEQTPEQEALYAPDFGVARSGLPPDAPSADDRLAEQQAGGAEATSAPISRPRWIVAITTAVFALVAQGVGVVLAPYAFTRWQPGAPAWPVVVQTIGAALIAVAGIVLAWAFTQFAAEGVGVPMPGEPTSQRLTVGGPYRYVRNPLYLASVAAVCGQALVLSRPVLLIYAAAIFAVTFVLARWIEDPALARRFGQEFEDYRSQVPGWWPRLPRRTP